METMSDPITLKWTMRAGHMDPWEFIEWLPKCDLFVEIGAYAGELTERLMQSGKVEKLVAIDPWRDIPTEDCYIGMGKVEAAFDQRVKQWLDAGRVVKVKSTGAAASDVLRMADIVYIDALHDYESVKRDIEQWQYRTFQHGWLCGHDYHAFKGVTQAVDEAFGQPDMVFSDTSWAVGTPRRHGLDYTATMNRLRHIFPNPK